MKNIIPITLAAVAWLSATQAQAWTYNDGDTLLIFRESGYNDVEFDIGNISQFTNLSSGTTIPVNNWSLNLVTNTFGADLTGVSVIVAATTSATNATLASWLSNGDPTTTPNQVTPSQWQSTKWSIINSIGTRPVIYQVSTSGANGYSIDPTSNYKLASYDQIVTGNGQNAGAIAQFGGNAAFTVEGLAPSSFGLWQISPTLAIPKPAATLIGNFHLPAAGGLTFTAGSGTAAAPSISRITRSGGVTTVSFSTAASSYSYSLQYSSSLYPASWTTVAGPVAGSSGTQSLTHTTSGGAGYYRVVRTP